MFMILVLKTVTAMNHNLLRVLTDPVEILQARQDARDKFMETIKVSFPEHVESIHNYADDWWPGTK